MDDSGCRFLPNLLSSSLRLGSDEDSGQYCSPCDFHGGGHVMASGYCQNCRERLCDQCIASHEKATHSMNHVIDRMTVTTDTSSDELPNCTTHQSKEELYCRVHEKLGCVICMRLSHNLCEIDYIPEVSEDFLKTEHYLTFEQHVNNLKVKCALNISKIEADSLSVDETYSDVIAAVKETKKEITDTLDKFEKELEDTVSEYRNQNLKTLESLKRDYEAIVREVNAIESETQRMQKDRKYNSLFCEVKHATEKIQEYQSRTYELATSYCIQECIFKKNQTLGTILTKEVLFGLTEVNDLEVGPCSAPEKVIKQPIGQINIKAGDDKNTCYATGLAFLSADQLAVADKANRNVKIVDVTYDKMISKVALSSSPRDITIIPPDQMAVTLRDEKIIQLLSTASGLSKLDQIKTVGKCRGIEYYNGKLIVTCDELLWPHIQILSLKGQILQRFTIDQTGQRLTKEPKCLAFSPDLHHMYVTDFTGMGILRLSQCGKLTAACRSLGFKYMGLAVSNGGSVYACATRSDLVLQFSDDLSSRKEVLNEQDGINGPIALAFSKPKNTIYVSCGNGGKTTCDKLFAFKIFKQN